jgi:hypothetical protein
MVLERLSTQDTKTDVPNVEASIICHDVRNTVL